MTRTGSYSEPRSVPLEIMSESGEFATGGEQSRSRDIKAHQSKQDAFGVPRFGTGLKTLLNYLINYKDFNF